MIFSLKLAYTTSYMMFTLLALYHQNKTKSFWVQNKKMVEKSMI